MNQHQAHLASASSLRADILKADAVWLPRREVLLTWLNGFIGRLQTADYELGETELADLEALGRFLHRRHIPAAAPV